MRSHGAVVLGSAPPEHEELYRLFADSEARYGNVVKYSLASLARFVSSRARGIRA